MARIELRHCTVYMRDGLAGTAAVDETPAQNDTEIDIDTVDLPKSANEELVPVGARFTLEGETGSPVHVVTARTPEDSGPTTNIQFTPALAAAVTSYDGSEEITFLPQQLEIKIGEGEVDYTESNDYIYDLDRGDLDTVREGDQQPMEVNLAFTYEHITTGTGETIAPMDALKRKGAASEWVPSSDDPCEPYCVDLIIEHDPPCGAGASETTVFPDFRSDSRNPSFTDSTITISGRCNATEPEVSRGDE